MTARAPQEMPRPPARDWLFRELTGSWHIARVIEPEGALDGTAHFSRRDGGWLAYAEQGELTFAGGSFAARQSYLFEPLTYGFAVWFDTEPRRLFHEIVLSEQADGLLTGSASHACGDDTYVSFYAFAPDGSFTIRHRVTGPNKNYTATTAYTRRTHPEIAA